MRAFLAVPSDPLWVDSARGLVERLRAALPRASWTRPESWHLTLEFLGEIDADAVRRYSEDIEPAAFETVPGEIQARPAVVFPDERRPRVVGIGFAPSAGVESLTRLAVAGREAAVRLGVTSEARRFHPHVTFARLREPWSAAAIEDYRREVEAWRFPAWHARSCVLFESRLDPAGAVHTPLREWTFQGGPRGVRA